jgi:hypothetical protein
MQQLPMSYVDGSDRVMPPRFPDLPITNGSAAAGSLDQVAICSNSSPAENRSAAASLIIVMWPSD